MTPRDSKMLEVARTLAATSRHHKARVGAVLTDGKDVVSVGINGRKSHPLQKEFCRFDDDDKNQHLMHAELEAIAKCRHKVGRFRDATMYVFRLKKTGVMGVARPCSGCMEALKRFGIQRMVYSTDTGYADEVIL